MKVCHVLASSSPHWGGPPIVVRRLARAMAPFGVTSTIVALRGFGEEAPLNHDTHWIVRYGINAPKVALAASPRVPFELAQAIRSSDLAHIHEPWHFAQAGAAITCAILEVPYVFSPHGAFEPWCMNQHRVAKKLAWHMYQKQILLRSSGIHVMSDSEGATIRGSGIHTPIRVIANGVETERTNEAVFQIGDDDRALTESCKPYILFLGRLDHKKGLITLAKAFTLVAAVRPDMTLLVAGPDRNGVWLNVERVLREHSLETRAKYLGFVTDAYKSNLFANAEVFVLPSKAEGVSTAVIEALSHGLPVVISEACNLPEVADWHAGLVVPPDAPTIASAILEILSSSENRKSMGASARRLAEEKFSLRTTARQMIEFYEEALRS